MENTDVPEQNAPSPPTYRHISVEERDGVLVLRFVDLGRELESMGSAQETYGEFGMLASRHQNCSVILDLEGQEVSASELFICYLVRLHREVTQVHGTLKLCNLSPQFAEELRMIRLDRMFSISESVDAAMLNRPEPRSRTSLMADQCDPQSPPRLIGYDCWLYQMPCTGNSGDFVVSVALSGDTETLSEPPSRWLVAIGDVCEKDETVARLKEQLVAEINRIVGMTGDPASILTALNKDLFDPDKIACLLVPVIDNDCHELTLASAGFTAPFLRSCDRRVVSIGEKAIGMPLWLVPGQTYENVTVAVGAGEVVIFYCDGVTAVVNRQNEIFNLNSLRQAIAQSVGDAASVGQSILEAIRRFRHGRVQTDDITFLCVGRVSPKVTHER